MLPMAIDHLLRCNLDAIALQHNCFGTTLCQGNIIHVGGCRT